MTVVVEEARRLAYQISGSRQMLRKLERFREGCVRGSHLTPRQSPIYRIAEAFQFLALAADQGALEAARRRRERMDIVWPDGKVAPMEREQAAAVGVGMMQSRLVWWSTEMWRGMQAQPPPPHRWDGRMPWRFMMFVPEVDMVLQEADPSGEETVYRWMLLLCAEDTLSINLGLSKNRHGEAFRIGYHPLGAIRVGQLVESPALLKALGALYFMQQPLLCESTERPVPADERMLARAPREMSIISLRALARERGAESEAGNGIEREFRWWVRGHWRAQWYPSRGSHEMIWVAPYLKGEEGKPVRESMHAVIR